MHNFQSLSVDFFFVWINLEVHYLSEVKGGNPLALFTFIVFNGFPPLNDNSLVVTVTGPIKCHCGSTWSRSKPPHVKPRHKDWRSSKLLFQRPSVA